MEINGKRNRTKEVQEQVNGLFKHDLIKNDDHYHNDNSESFNDAEDLINKLYKKMPA